MDGQTSWWIFGSLFSGLICLLGLSGIIAANQNEERAFSFGLAMQGIILLFVVAGSYYRGLATLPLGGFVAGLLLIVFSQQLTGSQPDDSSRPQENQE